MTQLFSDFDLPSVLQKNLQALNLITPTPIQQDVIPLALQGRDVLGTAQTGTGKTLAFALPMVTYLMQNPTAHALVLAPTRELAAQVLASVKPLLKDVNSLRSALLIGGESMGKQMAQLRGRPRLIVGTPGRIHDHLRRGTLALDQASFLVLDETDRMLDMGFGKDLQAIVGVMQSPRQTLLFSATLSKTIEKVAQAYLVKSERIAIGSSMKPALTVDQDSAFMQEHEKYDHLLGELERRDGSVIVFVNTKRGAEHLADKLKSANHRVGALHGDLRQNHRDRVIQSFRRQDYTVMVATDVAARGLDIPHIAHVINYDLPQCAEDYIHRIGRTGRAGTTGSALCMVSPNDNGKWRAIQKLMDPNANNSDPEPFPRSARSRSGGGGYGGGQRRSGGGGGGGYGQRREGASPQGFRSFGGGRRRSSGR